MDDRVQEKGWMVNRVMSIWKEKIRYPYRQGTPRSASLLDATENHIHNGFIDSVDEQGTQVTEIPEGFSSFYQPCDVGIMKFFKMRLAEMCQAWKVCKYSNMGRSRKIPTSASSDVLNWLDAIWNELFPEPIKNSFHKCGFTDDVNLSRDAALEII